MRTRGSARISRSGRGGRAGRSAVTPSSKSDAIASGSGRSSSCTSTAASA
jgi:hypothetical protein